MSLAEREILRYSRQIILPQVGGLGQERIKAGRVLIVGAGGLGSPAALYLAAAGVGTLGLCDDDEVDITNLHRQVLHFTPDVGRAKTSSAAEKLKLLNPEISVIEHTERFIPANARRILAGYDLVVDASDTFASKFFINDVCAALGIPHVFGGTVDFAGQVLTVIPGISACYRCFFREPPPPGAVPTCAQAGILGPVAGVIGSIQALEALKLLIGAGAPLAGRLLIFDGLEQSVRHVGIKRDRRCPACGEAPHRKDVFSMNGGESGLGRACDSGQATTGLGG